MFDEKFLNFRIHSTAILLDSGESGARKRKNDWTNQTSGADFVESIDEPLQKISNRDRDQRKSQGNFFMYFEK